MTYYKAVRPDGTSFHDRSFRWLPESGPVEGHTVTHPTASTVGEHASSYLSVSVTPTDCTGMRWPCRLFEVEPVDGQEVTTPDPTLFPSKRASVAWRIVRELPATESLGPQGVHVAALIERDGLTSDESQRLVAAMISVRDAAWGATGDAVWDAARDAARSAAFTAAMISVRDAAWGAARSAAFTAAMISVRDAAWGVWDAARAAARSAAFTAAVDAGSDAVWALVVRDIISTKHYDALTMPWRTAIGPIHPDDPDNK